jgi:hypothetical protein
MTAPSIAKIPGATHSPFGGLWIDRLDMPQLLEQALAEGTIDEQEAGALTAFSRDGFVVLPGAIDHDLLDRVQADIDSAWRGEAPLARVEYPTEDGMRVDPPTPELRERDHKLLNLHTVSDAARDAIFAPRLVRFLELIFEARPLAFSTLAFERGTRQPIHQDTAYVEVSAPLEMAASWIALEDVAEGSGELEYFVGSHRIPDVVFEGSRLMPVHLYGEQAYNFHLHAECQRLGLEHRTFLPKRGDVLVWNADLVHGGTRDLEQGRTRRSLVTHYCPEHRDPGYFAYWEHSDKLDHGDRARWCHYIR